MAEKIKVVIEDLQKDIKIPTGVRMLVRRCCNAVLKTEQFPGSAEVSVTFVNNRQMADHNKKYRNIDAPTDVLSFPLGENGKYDINPENNASMLGDIVISIEKAYEQADCYGHSLQREVGYLTAHGMLHLLGYDHEISGIEAVRMREKEELVLTMLGLPKDTNYVMDV